MVSVSPLESLIGEANPLPLPLPGGCRPDFSTAGLRAEAPSHGPGGGREALRIGLMEQKLETGAR